MTRRTKEELKREFDRLSSITQVIRDYQRREMPGWADFIEHLPDKDKSLQMVANGRFTMSQIISSAQMEINDFQLGLRDFDPARYVLLSAGERGPNAPNFIAYYKERTGRDFHLDVTDPAKIARTVLKMGRIADEVEYYVLVELLNNLSQTVVSQSDLTKIGMLVAAYEDAQRGDMS